MHFLHEVHKMIELWEGCGSYHSNTTPTLHETHIIFNTSLKNGLAYKKIGT